MSTEQQYRGHVLQTITGGVAVWRGTTPGRLADALRIAVTADEIKRWLDARQSHLPRYYAGMAEHYRSRDHGLTMMAPNHCEQHRSALTEEDDMNACEADRIFTTAREMWGIEIAIFTLRDLAREIDPNVSPIIGEREACRLLVREGWTLRDFIRRFS